MAQDRGGTCLVIVTVTAETITVPMGTFDTLNVHLQYARCYDPQVFDYWFHRDPGPVRIDDAELVSIEGSVATETQTWSEVKSLFR